MKLQVIHLIKYADIFSFCHYGIRLFLFKLRENFKIYSFWAINLLHLLTEVKKVSYFYTNSLRTLYELPPDVSIIYFIV